MMCNNPNLGLFNINAYTKFGKILSFCLKIFSGNIILNLIQAITLYKIKGHNSITNAANIMSRFCQYKCMYKIW